ncbi:MULTISPECIES: pyruvate, water dikinase regulatory protein [Idiomarina]|uniref:posphoenolpyruvate synthetase regulatory kinase/phosphorylase PpsR n=1 Tax=Idiomarina TaxID=135575 RepID=UPI0023571243|nr:MULTISPECIES: pyruvate, water dikinase regulatory protein [Idiomarina]|tara:strand:+ start:937 stop:1746 length:810 start_codon:yes stop_codon:yes gene_type:complete
MRTAFYVSDGTALTAEAFGHALLSMFPTDFRHKTLPFIDTQAKAEMACKQIQRAAEDDGEPPLIFHTFVNVKLKQRITQCGGISYDFLDNFVGQVEHELGIKAKPKTHRTHGVHKDYNFRVEAINYALDNDDGKKLNQLDQADLILVGVSRTGKTPTSLYLAMQYGIKVANYPITEDDDFERLSLPYELKMQRHKLFGLTLDSQRLHEIRSQRREGSQYASMQQCRFELSEVEKLYRKEAIPFINSTRFSVEEIAAKILAQTNLQRRRY